MARDPYKLFPHDYLLRATMLRVVPDFVKPNHLTMARLLLTPFVVYLLVTEQFVVGLPLFVLTAFTDALDGSLARTRRQITPWGIVFDPVADKLLIGLVAVAVAVKYFHPAVVAGAIFFDVLPLLVWMLRAKQQRGIMMANLWGKSKMIMQFLAVSSLLLGLALQLPVLVEAGEWLLIVAVALGAVAAITYSL